VQLCILAERKMRAHFIVVGSVICQQFAKVPFPEHHDMVEAFASDRSNQPFNMTVLPRRAGRDWSISDACTYQLYHPNVLTMETAKPGD
jgi:hypothetical protein